MKRIDSSYKLNKFLSGRISNVDIVVHVVTVEFMQVGGRCIDWRLVEDMFMICRISILEMVF